MSGLPCTVCGDNNLLEVEFEICGKRKVAASIRSPVFEAGIESKLPVLMINIKITINPSIVIN